MARPVGRRGETRARVVCAAVDLFAEHGVGGTSLQMIAARLGVTKAAVYHQFQTKDDIVLAVLGPTMALMDEFLPFAERGPTLADRRDRVITGLVDLVLDHRQVVAALYGDPGLTDIIKSYPEITRRIERVKALLLGPDPDACDVITAAMLGGAVMSVGLDPRLADTDRDVLRREVLAAARRLLATDPDAPR